MTKVFIVEDNEDQLISLKHKLDLLGHEIVGVSTRADNVFSELERTNPDIILLDINFNNDNEGLVLAERINKSLNSAIIFVSALSSHDVLKNAAATNPSGYLVKPVSVNDLKASIELALHRKINGRDNSVNREIDSTQSHISVRTGFKLRKIDFDRIILLETESKNYITLTIKKDSKAVIRNSLKAICESTLPAFFIQVHRQYVVNMNFIKMINEKQQMVHLEDNIHVPIGRRYKKELYERLNLI